MVTQRCQPQFLAKVKGGLKPKTASKRPILGQNITYRAIK